MKYNKKIFFFIDSKYIFSILPFWTLLVLPQEIVLQSNSNDPLKFFIGNKIFN